MAFNITLENNNYTIDQFLKIDSQQLPDWANSAQNFIRDWMAGKEVFTQATSGSTGKAKPIQIRRAQMIASALNTTSALQLKEGALVLHCINSAYIGGKMMWVRALLGNWKVHLIKPVAEFEQTELWHHYDFAAMVPLQISKTLSTPKGKEVLDRFDQVIVGGAAVPADLANLLATISGTFYSTFGMTETVSHIALKQLNGVDKENDFFVIGDNQIDIDKEDRLKIKGEVTNQEWILTNDIVSLTPKGFKWLGRHDLVVNSGGIKINIEKAEDQLRTEIPALASSFVFWKENDLNLGEKLIGITTDAQLIEYLSANHEQLISTLPKYHFPKRWYLSEQIHLTANNKVNRQITAENLLEQFNF